MGSRIPAYPAIDCIEQGYAQPRSPMSSWTELLRRRSAAAAHSSESEAVALLPPGRGGVSHAQGLAPASEQKRGRGRPVGTTGNAAFRAHLRDMAIPEGSDLDPLRPVCIDVDRDSESRHPAPAMQIARPVSQLPRLVRRVLVRSGRLFSL